MLQRWGIPKSIIILSILFVTGLFFAGFMQELAYSAGQAVQAIEVSGTITENTTWTAANSPYVITETVTVPDGITLTIEAGVTVMGDGTGFAIISVEAGGHLAANGTSAEPVAFTSVLDSGPGEWTSIVIVGTAKFQHTNFRNSEFNLDILGSSGDPIVLQDVLISNSSIACMLVAVDALHRLDMSNVTFTSNAKNRVLLKGYSDEDQLVGDAVLKPMPGLEGYEYYSDSDSYGPELKVPQGITLTLQAGTTLFMPKDSWLWISGYLEVLGELNHPVTFTATNALLPEAWIAIIFDETGSGVLNYAEIWHTGMAGIGIGFGFPETPVKIENSLIADGDYGVLASINGLHRLEMKDVTFANNKYNRVGLESGAYTGIDTIIDDVVLTAQPGLEAYEIEDDFQQILVPAGVQLMMDPGTTLLMSEWALLKVEGTFQMNGSAQEPATIQSKSLEIEWLGVALTGGSAVLNHGQLMDADAAVSLRSPTSILTVTNTTFTQNNTGILANFGSVSAVCTTFSNNTRGVHLQPGVEGMIDVHQSSFRGNLTAGIDNEGISLINAENNWWGSASGPGGEGPGSGDAVFGNVLYTPWLDANVCGAVEKYEIFLPVMKRP